MAKLYAILIYLATNRPEVPESTFRLLLMPNVRKFNAKYLALFFFYFKNHVAKIFPKLYNDAKSWIPDEIEIHVATDLGE